MAFAETLIAWQRQSGRSSLPWQNTRDPYAIWVSEIMLQQTQVATVIPYYQRFMSVFGSVSALAYAEQEEVMKYWSGLGYYTRARNLHQAAQIIITEHGGKFPESLEAIEALPGIGRSTAAAIAAFAFGQRQAILDGNVKRLFARHFGISGWTGQPAVEKQLWALAESLLPETGIEAYTQGLMDLGATLCTRSLPDCARCPFQSTCVAYNEDRVAELPSPRPRKSIPEKTTIMLILCSGTDVLLEKRPSKGIWGGLWSLPEFSTQAELASALKTRYGVKVLHTETLPCVVHTFTHFRLNITPLKITVASFSQELPAGSLWMDKEEAVEAALPAPVKNLLKHA